MTSRLATGVLVAAAAALVASDAMLFGIAAWKILFALAGLAVFRFARRP